MTDCTHPRLVHVVNREFGGSASTTYKCEVCKNLLTVAITPFTIKVKYPSPEPAQKGKS
jgi:hypothetical protein